MKDDVPIEIRLYYYDVSDVNDIRVTVETTTFTYHAHTGHAKHFNDVRLDLPVLRDTDPWAVKSIGGAGDLHPDTRRSRPCDR